MFILNGAINGQISFEIPKSVFLVIHSESFNFARFSFFSIFSIFSKKFYLSDKVALQLPNNVRLPGNCLKAILQKVHKTAAKVIILSALEANELIS